MPRPIISVVSPTDTTPKRKSFRWVAKPTRRSVGTVKTGNKLPMATRVLLYETDEVARNGVLGKLRPEVNPGAPLHN